MVDPSFGAVDAPENSHARRTDAFGSYLREARTKRHLSQSELAHRIGLSAGMVSQLEKGLSLPSVSTMLAIANELEVSLDSLFGATGPAHSAQTGRRSARFPEVSGVAWDAHVASAPPLRTSMPGSPNAGIEAAVQRQDSRALLTLEDGVTWELLTNNPNHQVLFVIVTYPVGAATAANRTFVRHPDVEYFLMLEGELDVSLEFERTTVRAGDAMWFDSMRPHNFENRGEVPARGVFFLIPQP